jgi:hypothetical protein
LGAKSAVNNWLFYIDADERCTPELKEEVSLIVSQYRIIVSSAYAVPRRNFIFGQEFKHSGQYPDYQKRLFKKSALKKWSGDVHEEPEFVGDLGHLKNPLIHLKQITIQEMVEKTDKWSEIEAELMFAAHHPPMNVIRFGSAVVREFWLRMIIQTAFLDGPKGIIYAFYQVFSKFVSYSKLYELQLKTK